MNYSANRNNLYEARTVLRLVLQRMRQSGPDPEKAYHFLDQSETEAIYLRRYPYARSRFMTTALSNFSGS